MYELSVTRTFDAAHFLYDYDGKCANMHGHTWKVEAVISATALDGRGMVCDFIDVRAALDQALRPFDHAVVNEVPPFDGVSPTAENLARHVYEVLNAALLPMLSGTSRLSQVRVFETPTAYAAYSAPVEFA